MLKLFSFLKREETKELLEKISKLQNEISLLKEEADRKESYNRKLIHEVQLLNQFTQVLNENIILNTTVDHFTDKIKKNYNIENIMLYLIDTFRKELKFYYSSHLEHLSPEEHTLLRNKGIPIDKNAGINQ